MYSRSQRNRYFILDSVKEEPQVQSQLEQDQKGQAGGLSSDDGDNLQDEAEMVVVKADPEDFPRHWLEPLSQWRELGPLTSEMTCLGPPVKVGTGN